MHSSPWRWILGCGLFKECFRKGVKDSASLLLRCTAELGPSLPEKRRERTMLCGAATREVAGVCTAARCCVELSPPPPDRRRE
eukprot:scaffold151402_cov14-Tisochrysis_lutea.AAC.1